MADVLQAGALPRLVCPAPETAAEDGKTDGEKVSSQPWSKVFIDINGNRTLAPVVKVLERVLQMEGVQLVAVKSKSLHAYLSAGRADYAPRVHR